MLDNGLRMKRSASFFFLGLCLSVLILSCGRDHQHRRFAGFQQDARDTVFIDLADTLYPASSLTLDHLVKCDGYYFLSFCESYRIRPDFSRTIILALSEKTMSLRPVPLPPSGQIATKDGHLVAWDRYNDVVLTAFNTESWSWESIRVDKEAFVELYEDDDWVMRYADHGEFGYMCWFIDRHTSSEYAFSSLFGDVHRIDSTYYVVSKTRIYEIPDPREGFLCDSTTRYEFAKDVQVINAHFFRKGYYSRHKPALPLIEFDHLYTEGETRSLTPLYDLSPAYYEYEFEYAMPDTVILGSFKSADTLYCLLNTPLKTVLTKLDDGHLSTVHAFPKRYEIQDFHTRTDPEDPGEERLVVLASDGEGASLLIEIGRDGNNMLSLQYPHGLVLQENDGFEPLLDWLLTHWGSFTFEDARVEEETLGGKVSMLDLNLDSFPRLEELRSPEPHHTEVIAKQIADSLFIYSEYRVRKLDSIVTAVCLDWQAVPWFYPSLYDAVYDNLSQIICRRFGSPDAVRHPFSYSEYKEWQTAPFSIRLERSYDRVTATFY